MKIYWNKSKSTSRQFLVIKTSTIFIIGIPVNFSNASISTKKVQNGGNNFNSQEAFLN